ncbi:hypothetical protein P280DRAFT_521635 [Massarina eburnea CBS 473.64]|uniref:Cytochrome P450 n=1 Tax=Massarina eburnea CBS 473.64 TaxID=1395130 RepID=A0A6A6RNL4_9PLEO|nr:hypothetical protein P280DRAFT_521635 [Massarina eburnea CBS 473.64]
MSDNAVERLGSETEETPKYFKRKYLAAAPLYAWSSSVIHRYLAGRSALQLSQWFGNNLRVRFQEHQALNTAEGVVLDNFLDFFSNDVTAALLDAMCGKGLLECNPGFTRAFWTFCDNFPTFMKRTPRFLARKATTPLDEDGDDLLWGSAFFRERFSTFVYEMGFDARDMASMELGFLFGASENVIMNTYWCAIDVFKDQPLLRVSAENKLIQQPLLQAVLAESLSLRCHNMFIRKTTEVINIMSWAIPKDRFVIAWSTPGQMDSKVWSNTDDLHPVDTFWPGRFLKYTDVSESPQFSARRHFAKIHCIVTLAMMVEIFDCNILAEPKVLKVDQSKFGMGVLAPSGKVVARLRGRETTN